MIYDRLFICDNGTCEVIACFGVNDSYWRNRELIAQLVHVVDLFVERQPTRTPISDPNWLGRPPPCRKTWVVLDSIIDSGEDACSIKWDDCPQWLA